MIDHPVFLVVLIAASLYVGKWWIDDARAARAGHPDPRALPGASFASSRAVMIAVAGALLILALETVGESALGLSAQQSRITWLWGAYTLVAAIIEEVIFRGYLVIEGRGPAARWAGIVAASVAFALLHPFLWEWEEQGFALTPTLKGVFSTGVVFATSLWLYTVRFARWNPTRSLLPCIAAHAAKNAGVLVIKVAQGFVGGWW